MGNDGHSVVASAYCFAFAAEASVWCQYKRGAYNRMSHGTVLTRWLLTTVVYFGAFLLFSVEFLVANLLTPRFGGGAVAWLTALMFFQVVLFFGYAYAHYFAPKIKVWHLAVIGAAGVYAASARHDDSVRDAPHYGRNLGDFWGRSAAIFQHCPPRPW